MSTAPEFTYVGLQPAMIDERVEQPHPYNVNRDGSVRDQEFWNGDPAQLVGFLLTEDAYGIDLLCEDFMAEPERAKGCYAVFARADGSMFNLVLPVVEIDLYFDEPAKEVRA